MNEISYNTCSYNWIYKLFYKNLINLHYSTYFHIPYSFNCGNL